MGALRPSDRTWETADGPAAWGAAHAVMSGQESPQQSGWPDVWLAPAEWQSISTAGAALSVGSKHGNLCAYAAMAWAGIASVTSSHRQIRHRVMGTSLGAAP